MVTAVRVELTRGVLSIHFALLKGVPTVQYSASRTGASFFGIRVITVENTTASRMQHRMMIVSFFMTFALHCSIIRV